MAKSSTERGRERRARLKKEGKQRKEIECFPNEWKYIQAFCNLDKTDKKALINSIDNDGKVKK